MSIHQFREIDEAKKLYFADIVLTVARAHLDDSIGLAVNKTQKFCTDNKLGLSKGLIDFIIRSDESLVSQFRNIAKEKLVRRFS
jgi:hypothetical protein